jgi:hypothetical protein
MPTKKELEAENRVLRAALMEHLSGSEWHQAIEGWLNRNRPKKSQAARFASHEILTGALGIAPAQQDRWAYLRLKEIMETLGWRQAMVEDSTGKRCRGWRQSAYEADKVEDRRHAGEAIAKALRQIRRSSI